MTAAGDDLEAEQRVDADRDDEDVDEADDRRDRHLPGAEVQRQDQDGRARGRSTRPHSDCRVTSAPQLGPMNEDGDFADSGTSYASARAIVTCASLGSSAGRSARGRRVRRRSSTLVSASGTTECDGIGRELLIGRSRHRRSVNCDPPRNSMLRTGCGRNERHERRADHEDRGDDEPQSGGAPTKGNERLAGVEVVAELAHGAHQVSFLRVVAGLPVSGDLAARPACAPRSSGGARPPRELDARRSAASGDCDGRAELSAAAVDRAERVRIEPRERLPSTEELRAARAAAAPGG